MEHCADLYADAEDVAEEAANTCYNNCDFVDFVMDANCAGDARFAEIAAPSRSEWQRPRDNMS